MAEYVISGRQQLLLKLQETQWFLLTEDFRWQAIDNATSAWHRSLASDAEQVSFDDDETAIDALAVAYGRTVAFDGLLFLLDSSLSHESRLKIATQIESMLANSNIRAYVEDILYSEELPASASLNFHQSLNVREAEKLPAVCELLRELISKQPAIRSVVMAWNLVDDSLFESAEHRRLFTATAIYEGIFRRFAQAFIAMVGAMKSGERAWPVSKPSDSLESKEHRRKAAALRGAVVVMRVCSACGVEYQSTSLAHGSVFCSVKCRSTAYAEKGRQGVVEATCSYCGETFMANKFKAKRAAAGLRVTCSDVCRNRMNMAVCLARRCERNKNRKQRECDT